LVKHFYDRGVRCLTLCHTRHNDICDSSTDTTRSPWNGLSPFGEEVVKEINRLGMLIDVSHISDSAFWDVLRTSKAPVIASHSACRVLASSPRNLDDDMLRALADRGGVVQICLVSFYLKTVPPNPAKESALDSIRQVYGDWDKAVDPAVQEKRRNAYYAVMRRYPDPMATVAEFVDHIDHAVKIVGIDHVGFGSDLDGGGGVEECNDVTQYPRITEELVRRGYNEGQIRKIWGGNTLRVLDKVAGIARSLQKKEKKT
jgi:membrane dipeptidase